MRRVQSSPFPKQARAEQEKLRAYRVQVRRTTSYRLYKSVAWANLRRDILFGAVCSVPQCTVAPTIVDHIKPHRGDQHLFFDRANLQPMCKRHHDQKTAKADGGFGRVKPVDHDYGEGDGFGMA